MTTRQILIIKRLNLRQRPQREQALQELSEGSIGPQTGQIMALSAMISEVLLSEVMLGGRGT